MRRRAFIVVCAAALVASGAARAEDGFTLCNRTALDIVYAKALNTSTGNTDLFLSQGWFKLAPGQCEIAWPGKLDARFYLIYAEAKASNRKWAGNVPVCVEDADFKISAGLCIAPRNLRRFIQVDTGENGTSFTYDLN